jgi:hypothetical protein
MKRNLVFVFCFVITLCAMTQATNTELVKNARMEKFVGDSMYRYTSVPWKCVYIYLATNDTATRYYTREGIEKARISRNLFAAIKQGAERRDYYETLRTYKSGKTKLVKNWYNYGIDYPHKSNVRNYYYNPGKCDKQGNWTYAEDIYINKKGIARELFYYDSPGYDPEEDAAIDRRIATLVSEVKEQENPLNIKNIAGSIFGLCARLLFGFGLFIMAMLLFRRQHFHLWFDIKATRKITPFGNAFFCRTVWYALLPVLAIFYPTVSQVMDTGSTAVIHSSLIVSTIIGIVIAIAYCAIFILLRSRKYSARCALWELLYSASIWVALWATLLFSFIVLMVCIVVIIIVEIFFGKREPNRADDSDSDDDKDHFYATSWDGECHCLSRLSDGYYMDTEGSIYMKSSGGGLHRLGDLKSFS